MGRPRVLLADDHRIVAEGLKSLLALNFEILGIVEDGRSLIAAAETLKPDVIILDITMPHFNGIDAIPLLRSQDPHVKIVILTMHQDPSYARRALAAGAQGFVLKHSATHELVLAINAALKGRNFISPALTAAVLRCNDRKNQIGAFTPRQREILKLLAEGNSAKKIGVALAISPRTVEFHKYQLMATHDIHGNAALIHFAITHGATGI